MQKRRFLLAGLIYLGLGAPCWCQAPAPRPATAAPAAQSPDAQYLLKVVTLMAEDHYEEVNKLIRDDPVRAEKTFEFVITFRGLLKDAEQRELIEDYLSMVARHFEAQG